MKWIESTGLRALHCFDPETAHGLSIHALNSGLVPLGGVYSSPVLQTSIAGLDLPNPLGLAAGMDKNAQALRPLSRTGFGFLEVGAATPRPQPGNPRPRLFRLTQDRAVINRFGFNNLGMDVIAQNLAKAATQIPRGLNLGANKDSDDRAADYAKVLKTAAPHIDFATVNVSSPNTQNLRDLQGRAALEDLLHQVQAANTTSLPIFLKIAPDLTEADLQDIAEVATACKISAIIATNTTLDRTGLNDPQKDQAGGLSGAPLFEKSTRVLAQLAQITDGKMPLIGVGGISNADQAYAKITAGASALQVYSALIYQGFSLIHEILKGLETLLERDGFTHISQAVGTQRDRWALL